MTPSRRVNRQIDAIGQGFGRLPDGLFDFILVLGVLGNGGSAARFIPPWPAVKRYPVAQPVT